MAKNILVDTCFWIALYDGRDNHHEDALLIAEDLFIHNILIPWPTMYEYLNTKFIRNALTVRTFKKILVHPGIEKIPDERYRENAFLKFFEPINLGRRLSLVDLVIREIIADERMKIHHLVTFNDEDFLDECAKRNIEIFNG